MTFPGPLRIEPIAGYTPTIGRLVGMLTYTRSVTIAAVEGLTLAELDYRHGNTGNTIGALLAHLAATERSYQILTFEQRLPSAEENAREATALKLGSEGHAALRGRTVEHYLEELARVRRDTLEALAARDDPWLEATVAPAPKLNAHWVWFHVAEHESSHCGQIRWLRARLAQGAAAPKAISS